jgi:hypothetical protein
MELTITSVDHAPEALHNQIPVVVRLIREIPGDDRHDYWLSEMKTSVISNHGNHERQITPPVLAARWEGICIEPHVRDLPIGIAWVTDSSLLNSAKLDLERCSCVAIGIARVTGGGELVPKEENL